MFPSLYLSCYVVYLAAKRTKDVLSCYVYSMLFDVLLSMFSCCLCLFGILFIALVMVPHDVCYSIENIGYNVVRTDPVTFCNSSLGGKYNKETQNCEDIPFPGE